MSLIQKPSSQSASFSWVSICIYSGLIACAYLIWRSLEVPAVVQGDASGYLAAADGLTKGEYASLFATFRPYGYPVFLALVLKITALLNMTDFYPVLFAAQFGVHIASAALATRIVRRSLPQHPAWTTYLVFAAVACNPYLLAMVTQILTETLSIFFITLFFYFLHAEAIQSSFFNRAWIGISLGLAGVTRPLNIVWAIGVIGLLILVTFWNIKIQKIWSFKARTKHLLEIGICFILVMLTQPLASSYFLQNVPSDAVNSSLASNVMQIHLSLAPVTYRYETEYNLAANQVFPVWYINTRLRPNAWKPEVVLMPFVKLVALFQQHDYKIYRTGFGILSSTAFTVGLVLWSLFCYVVPQALREVWETRGLLKPFPVGALLTMAMFLLVALYAVFTIPEPRYIFSIYPVLVALFAYYAVRPTRWWHFLTPLTVAVISYALTAHTLLWALHTRGRP